MSLCLCGERGCAGRWEGSREAARKSILTGEAAESEASRVSHGGGFSALLQTGGCREKSILLEKDGILYLNLNRQQKRLYLKVFY